MKKDPIEVSQVLAQPKELTIEIPDGKIVDWDESKKQNKIVLKDKQLTYKDVCKKLLGKDFCFIDGDGDILHGDIGEFTPNCAKTAHQLECILAKNQLANVAKYLNNGWKPKSGDIVTGLVLEGKDCNIIFPVYCLDIDKCYFPQFVFKTQKDALQAIEILGEETVKLALEPLGI